MVGSRLALTWARLYTRGMPDTARRARLDELSSDLWEHVDHALASGRRRGEVQLEIAGRTARGAATDVAWRFTQRTGPVAVTTVRWTGWLAFAAQRRCCRVHLWSAVPMLGVYSVDDWAPGDAREFARVTSADFARLVAGLALLARQPRAGASLVTIASAAALCRSTSSACGRCSSAGGGMLGGNRS